MEIYVLLNGVSAERPTDACDSIRVSVSPGPTAVEPDDRHQLQHQHGSHAGDDGGNRSSPFPLAWSGSAEPVLYATRRRHGAPRPECRDRARGEVGVSAQGNPSPFTQASQSASALATAAVSQDQPYFA